MAGARRKADDKTRSSAPRSSIAATKQTGWNQRYTILFPSAGRLKIGRAPRRVSARQTRVSAPRSLSEHLQKCRNAKGRLKIGRRLKACPTFLCRMQGFSDLVTRRAYNQYCHWPVAMTYAHRHPLVTACARMQSPRLLVRTIQALYSTPAISPTSQ